MRIRQRFSELLPELIAWRHDFHAHPETMFETHRTAALVAARLREFGCDEVVEGIGRTGVVGIIRGRQTGSGRVIGLRADMDALPIEEQTNLEYASRHDGMMHACGHDGHMAMLLGAAKYLAETRSFDGTAAIIFQPAEEEGGGGREMIRDGLMERFGIQEVYGMHNWPGMAPGQFAIRSGPFFAATDLFTIDIEGRAGHAAKPQDTIDATLVSAHLVTALQSIASRNIDPVREVVVSVTSFRTASDTHNVISGEVKLKGTVRTLHPSVRDLAEARLTGIATRLAGAFGATARVEYRRNYPAMVNAERETGHAAEAARRVAGDCADAPLVMWGEDFAFMLAARPGAYILIGNGDSAMVHSPTYDFCDDAIPAGCSWWVELVEMRMPIDGS